MRRFIPFLKTPPTVAVIRLHGIIAARGRGALSDAGLAGLIDKAFSKGKPQAVALSINSPGGSPAQSSLISARIRRLADEKDVKVYAFVEDVLIEKRQCSRVQQQRHGHPLGRQAGHRPRRSPGE